MRHIKNIMDGIDTSKYLKMILLSSFFFQLYNCLKIHIHQLYLLNIFTLMETIFLNTCISIIFLLFFTNISNMNSLI